MIRVPRLKTALLGFGLGLTIAFGSPFAATASEARLHPAHGDHDGDHDDHEAGHHGSDRDEHARSGDPHDHSRYEKRPRVGSITEIPDRTLAGLNTGSRPVSTLLKPGTIVHFWASWCAPCLEEFPEIEQFYTTEIGGEDALSGMSLIAISNDSRAEDAERFLSRFDASFPNFIDDRALLNGELLGSFSLPATVIIDSAGDIHRLSLGKLDWTFPGLPEILAKTIAVKTGNLGTLGSTNN